MERISTAQKEAEFYEKYKQTLAMFSEHHTRVVNDTSDFYSNFKDRGEVAKRQLRLALNECPIELLADVVVQTLTSAECYDMDFPKGGQFDFCCVEPNGQICFEGFDDDAEFDYELLALSLAQQPDEYFKDPLDGWYNLRNDLLTVLPEAQEVLEQKIRLKKSAARAGFRR